MHKLQLHIFLAWAIRILNCIQFNSIKFNSPALCNEPGHTTKIYNAKDHSTVIQTLLRLRLWH